MSDDTTIDVSRETLARVFISHSVSDEDRDFIRSQTCFRNEHYVRLIHSARLMGILEPFLTGPKADPLEKKS